MHRDELTELHYITHMDNVRSILRVGILSNKKASRVRHTSIAMEKSKSEEPRKLSQGDRGSLIT